MKILKPLRFILAFGNVLLLFRNVSFSDRKFRILMYFTASAEIILTILNGIIVGYYYLFHHFSDIFYVYMAFSNSILYVILSLYNSKRFYLLLNFLDANSNYVSKDGLYLKEFNRKIKIFKILSTLYIGMQMGSIVLRSRYRKLLIYEVPFIVRIILQANAAIIDIRFFYEYCLLCALLYLISEQLESVIRCITKEKIFVALIYKPLGENVTPEVITTQHIDDIARWSLAYTYLVEATCLFNNIFGVQITIMLISTISYLCIYLYSITFLTIHAPYDTATLVKYGIRVVVLLIEILILSRAAQNIHNNVDILRRHLARILIQTFANNNCYRAIKDLLHLISSHQMKIEAFGKITVDMSLPPTCILFFTSYTVIALQFNNVI